MKTNTLSNASLFFARVVLAIVVATHGAQKLLGWFGGYGFEATAGFFTETIGLPYIFAVLIILAESVGMIALAFGLTTRLLSVSLILIMIGAIVTVHGSFGFFMNWSGAQGGEGFEFHLLTIALATVTALNGGGAYSLDAVIKSRLQKQNQGLNLLFA